ncbi:MAG TPA: Zn-ribbon domain-containing OB-fold protein [Candidatus Dormibacteraeota bacterium]|nr:Zn-ribbon domain-containing OB-fold protein [Candidatus Dormibacteraeota bacterium]
MNVDKPVPKPTPETQPYWDGALAGELRIQRCTPCREFYFYPRPFCPRCLSADVHWVRVSGRARLHSYVINHRAAPGFEAEAPYVIAIVELEEGPRMMANVVDVEPRPERLLLDMDLEVAFAPRGNMHIPVFRPASGSPS